MSINRKNFPIGTLSALTGCKVPTIRYYEQTALLPVPARTEGNQRRYSGFHLKRLQFILHARALGFTLEDIRELISLSDQPATQHHADTIANKHLKSVSEKIVRLSALKQELERMLAGCQSGHSAQCQVIEVLSDHSLCHREHD